MGCTATQLSFEEEVTVREPRYLETFLFLWSIVCLGVGASGALELGVMNL